MSKEVLTICEEKMNKAIEFLNKELGSLKAGKANPKALDRISVNYYGTPTAINQVGNISSPEPRMLVITPYDSTMIKEIEKAIQLSDLGINPSNDGKIIRLVFPELTEERRKELVKTVKSRVEEGRVTLRSIRRDCNEMLKKEKADGTLTEDFLANEQDDVQKLTDSFMKKIETIFADKEKEVLNV